MMDTKCFCLISAPPWATPWPHLILFCACTINTDVKVSNLICKWLLWFVLPPTQVTSHNIACQNDKYWVFVLHLCTSMGDPWTPWENVIGWNHYSGCFACTLPDLMWIWVIQHPTCPWLMTLVTTQKAQYPMLHLCTSMGDPTTPQHLFSGMIWKLEGYCIGFKQETGDFFIYFYLIFLYFWG